MPTLEVPRAFDRISPQYDATREPLEPAALDRLGATLRDRGVHRLLEVGVGTGRIAGPLAAKGIRVTGIDASTGMLAQARQKGVVRLVRGTAYRLPFADGAFDGALFVHVIHLLEEPRAAIAEALRVGPRGAFALVRPLGDGTGERRPGPGREARRVFFRILGERGYPVPLRREGAGGPSVREAKVLAELPPDRLETLAEVTVESSVGASLKMFALGASRHTLDIPRDVLQAAADAALAEVGDRPFSYRRVEALAQWTRRPAP
ncbi:MAG TPA: class I SAM-dependent methyltransferase [Thermoplasmata archaeon]|jgi:SAM-dependent methyltransferase|nr:class I SAM-dependent methyltransferase [Thermoplasmata archaeon]